MDDDCYIGIDLGTTTIKAGVVTADGSLAALAVREVPLVTPAPGRVEFDADAYLALAFESVRDALQSTAAERGSVKAIGVSSQAQTFVLLDDNDTPLRPAVSWLDVRAEHEAETLSEESLRIGHRKVNAIESGPKLVWLKRHEPEVMAKVRHVLLMPDHLIFRLTGIPATDPVTAGSTGMYDRARGKWLEPLLHLCGLTPEMMPQVAPPGSRVGTLSAETARELGLSPDTLVAVGTNDQSVGALGAGNVTPGCASITLGTALAIIVTSRSGADAPEGVGVGLHPVKGLYTLLAYAKTSGIVLQWLRDLTGSSLSYDQLFAEIASVPIGSAGVTCIPHFSGAATPAFNPSVRGAFTGLTLAHGRSHLARAVVESLSFTIRENLVLLSAAADGITDIRVWGGGAKSDVWLQMIADATGHAVERVATTEAAVLGAAELAMVAAGRFPGVAEASLALYRADRRFEPDAALRPQYDLAFARYRALCEALYP